ncbi:MAG: cyclase family protein [Pseudomonadota bacterium]
MSIELRRTALAAITAGVVGLAATAAFAEDAWYPSKFGKDDEAGRSNLMTAERVKEAMTFIKNGNTVSLARTYEAGMPLFGQRAFAVRGTSGLAGGPLGDNEVVWMDDFLSTEIGQVGTQFDGLGHIGIGSKFYNGIEAGDVIGPTGLKRLGIEKLKPFFTKGVLLDMVALKGAPLEKGYEITVGDLEAALKAQGLSADAIGEGHVVMIHTGWGRLWKENNVEFNSGCPGIGVAAGKWLADKGVAVVGADTWPVEVVPNPNPKLAFPVHQIFLTRNGIFIHENVATERLADAKVYEFAYIFNPLAVKGATGSPGNAMAAF